MKTHTRATTLAAVMIAVVFGISGCGGSDEKDSSANGEAGNGSAESSQTNGDGATETDESPAALFQFDEAKFTDDDQWQPWMTEESAFTVRLSEGLKSAIPAGRSVAVDSYDVRVKAFPTGQCRVDVDVHWADGGLEAMEAAAEAGVAAAAKNGQERTVAEEVMGSIGWFPGRVAETLPTDDEIVGDISAATEDMKHYMVVDECQPPDPSVFENEFEDELRDFLFPYSDFDEDGDTGSFAEAELWVVQGTQGGSEGQTSIIYVEDVNADLGLTGDWVAEQDS